MEHNETGGFWDWFFPAAFVICAGWVVWHLPVFILDVFPPDNESSVAQITAIHNTKDVTPGMAGLFGGFADAVDWAALILMPIIFVLGAARLKCAPMEFQKWRNIDRVAIFIGRVTMILIITMTCVMLYEVFLRYVVERPTLWANELTLWIAGFVFLCSGFYAMQQRSHIRIFLLYDVVPRNVQRIFDVISTLMIAIFAFFLVFGSYKQVFLVKFQRWEMFGTAFDPPIPATVQPAILILVTLIAIQAVINLINDWNEEAIVHESVDDIDEEELEAIKRSVGSSK